MHHSINKKGKQFILNVNLLNNGKKAWTKNFKLFFVNNTTNELSQIKGNDFKIPSRICPNKDCTFEVKLNTENFDIGTYNSVLSMMTNEGIMFGESIVIKISIC